MKWNDLISENNHQVNYIVARVLRVTWFLCAVCWLLSEMRVFILDMASMDKFMIISTVLLWQPTLFVSFLKVRKSWLKYYFILITSVFTGMIYSLLTYHAILMFILPMMVAGLYFHKRLLKFTFVTNCFILVISHYLSYYFCVVPDEPLKSLRGIMLYGLLPRLLEFICLSFIIIVLTNRSFRMLKKFFIASNDNKRSKDGLNAIIKHSNLLYTARSCSDIASIMLQAMNDLFRFTYTSVENQPFGIAGVRLQDGTFYNIDSTLSTYLVTPEHGKTVVNIDGRYYNFWESKRENVSDVNLQESEMSISFYDDEKLAGYMVFHYNMEGVRDTIFSRLVNVLYNNIKLALSNAKLNCEVYDTQEELIQAFAEISESKSKQTGQHIKRVSEYMRVMASAINLDEKEKDNLAMAAMLHDIGKLMVPSEIVDKPGKLTKEEFDVIKKHVHTGYDLLKASPGRVMEIGKTIALQHHERYDGTGYLGIKGDEIDYYSRIMALVDVFDALVSTRSYKHAWKPEEAFDEIVSQSGSQFDPSIVKLFEDCFDEFLDILEQYPDEKNGSTELKAL